MTETYETPRLLGQPSKVDSYHTQKCRTIRKSPNEPKEVSQSLIEWHGFDECEYCSGKYTPTSNANPVVAND